MQIPGYRIIRRIAQGGMSTVYLAIQISVGRVVALKVMSPTLNGDPAFSERFQREANIVGQLSHPNIVSIYDIGRHNNLNYIAMDYLPGGSIHDKMVEGLTPEDALRVIREIASALDHAHDKGYVHRDIKPENILFRADNSSVLTDFGVAKAVSAAKVTNAGTVVGTPHYMSPEQTRGKTLDARSDFYSLGVVFYEMLTGTVPYQGDQPVSIAIKHLAAPIPKLPTQFQVHQKLLDKLLDKDPEQRFQRGRELVEAIEALEANIKSPTYFTDNDRDSVQIFALLKQLAAATFTALRNQAGRLMAYLNTLRWTPSRGIYQYADDIPETTSADSRTSAQTLAATRVQRMAAWTTLVNVRAQRLASWLLLSALLVSLAWAVIGITEEVADTSIATPSSAPTRELEAVQPEPTVADIEPEAFEPEAIEPEMTKPEAMEPEPVEPPSLTPPSATAPSIEEPEIEQPEIEQPEIALSDEPIAIDSDNDNTEPEVDTTPATPRHALTVDVTPADARVRIMNIREPYRPGIRLRPGRYQIEASHSGYHTYLEWVEITDKDLRHRVQLEHPPIPPGTVFNDDLTVGGTGPDMVVVPNGSFTMGSDTHSSSQPLRRVTINRAFAISKHEITFAQYEKFARAGDRPLPADNRWGMEDRPVIYVSWEQARDYARWLSEVTGKRYRLPSEAEWEYVARAGSDTDYWWGDDSADAKDRANCRRGCYSDHAGLLSSRTAPVGSYPANAFGVQDMAGNVAEWVQDCYQNHYAGTPTDGSAFEWPGCSTRVVRGGSHQDNASDLSSHLREHKPPDYYSDYIGFRVVLDLEQK